MLRMAPSKYLTIRISDDIDAALDAWCKARGMEKSDLIRQAVCQTIGRPELAGAMPKRGRPKPPPADAAPRKRCK